MRSSKLRRTSGATLALATGAAPALATVPPEADAASEATAWLDAKRSPATRRSYLGDLLDFGRWILGDRKAPVAVAVRATAAATLPQIAAYRDDSMTRHRPATTARRLAAIRAWFRFLQARQIRADNPAAFVEAPRVNLDEQKRPALELSDLRRLIEVATTGRRAKYADRNLAIVHLLGGIGLRSAELLALRPCDYDRNTQTIVVKGKRQQTRRLDLPTAAIAPLCQLADATPGDARIFAFTRERLRQLVTTWQRLAGLPQTGTHTFRRTMATLHFDHGGSAEQLRRTFGHADLRTTSRYDTRREGTAIVTI